MIVIVLSELFTTNTITQALRIFGFTSLSILFRQLWSDILKKEIDSRLNYFMFGTITTLCIICGKITEYIIVTFLFIFFYAFFSRIWADGDTETLHWIVGGLILFENTAPIVFLIILFVVCFIEKLINKIKKNYEKTKQGIPAILISLSIFFTLKLI